MIYEKRTYTINPLKMVRLAGAVQKRCLRRANRAPR